MSYGDAIRSDDATRAYGTATSSGGISSGTGSTTSDMTSSVQDMAGQAKNATSQLTSQVKEQASTKLNAQMGQATQGLGSVASALTQVGDQMRDQNPQIAQFADTASDKIEQFSRQLEQKDVSELLGDVERFARRQPLAFLGGAFALGLLGSRFLKSSKPESFQGYPRPRSSSYSTGTSNYSGYTGYAGSAGYTGYSGSTGTSGYPGSTGSTGYSSAPDYNRGADYRTPGSSFEDTTGASYTSGGMAGSTTGSTGYGSTSQGESSGAYGATGATGATGTTSEQAGRTGSQQTFSPYSDSTLTDDDSGLTDTFSSTSRPGAEG